MIEVFNIGWKFFEGYATSQNIAVWTLITLLLKAINESSTTLKNIYKWKVWPFLWKYFLMGTKRLGNFLKHLAFDIFLVSRIPTYFLHTMKNQIRMATKKKVAAKSAKKKVNKKVAPKKVRRKNNQ
jgi:hypothetical protein